MRQQLLQAIYCRSCGMPLTDAEDSDFGTNADGSKNEEYCFYCYQRGAFVNPEMTLAKMIKVSAKGWSDQDPAVCYEQALVASRKNIPTLKCWR